ncbi:MAG: CHC2 zinc finger domain-containing protein [Phycicoccus sp.]
MEGSGDSPRPSLEAALTFYGVHDHRRMVPCPLHEDRTPSCSVNYTKGVWHCHSCGEAGDAYTLIELKEGIDFAGASAFAANHNLGAEGSGGGGKPLRVSRFARPAGGGVSPGSRPGSGGGGYTPSWSRR